MGRFALSPGFCYLIRHSDQRKMDTEHASSSSPQRQLPAAVQLHVLSFLPPNDRALNGRLACKDAADGLSGPQDCTASLSQPLPPHAVPWALEAGQLHARTLTFLQKLLLVSTAAASGSEDNLEVALAMLRPSICAQVLQKPPSFWDMMLICPDPGITAVKAGHLHLLPWLVRHCPALLQPERVLKAAARHCNLAGLKAVWEVMRKVPCSNKSSYIGISGPALGQQVLDAAVGSATPDAVAKVEWVLATARRGSCSLGGSAEAAVRSGDLGRLRWLRDRGSFTAGGRVLLCALKHADLAMVRWLVEEAGCPLLTGDPQHAQWFRKAAAQSPDGAAKMQWLQERGAPPLEANRKLLWCVTLEAVAAGQVEVVRYLLTVRGAREALQAQVFGQAAAKQGSVAMAECLRQAGLVFDHTAYGEAAKAGSLAMVRWLAREARVSTAGRVLVKLKRMCTWRGWSPGCNRDLREAVQEVVGAAGLRDEGAGGGGNMLGAGADSDSDADSDLDLFPSAQPEDTDDESLGGHGAGSVLFRAMGRGDLALVQYLLQQQLVPRPQGQDVAVAVGTGCEALLEWAVGQLERPFKSSGAPYVMAAGKGDMGTLAALRRLGVPWGPGDGLAEAVNRGCVEPALRWLVEQGMPVGRAKAMVEAVACAAFRGDLSPEAAAWLRGLAAAETR